MDWDVSDSDLQCGAGGREPGMVEVSGINPSKSKREG